MDYSRKISQRLWNLPEKGEQESHREETFIDDIVQKSYIELKLLENLKNGEVFKKDGKVLWFCRNCGHVELAVEAPAVCPVCHHPQSYFQIKAENY